MPWKIRTTITSLKKIAAWVWGPVSSYKCDQHLMSQ